ncbi:MAG: DNA-binding protein WhiA [Clostridia bacterium]
MTFASEVKKECSRIDTSNACCADAELAAFIRLNGVLELGGNEKLGLSMKTENPATARRVYKLMRNFTDLPVNIFVRRKEKLNKNMTFMISVRANLETKGFLIRLGMMDDSYSIIPGIANKFVKKQCCRRAYLRGSFLASGAVSEPRKGDYHCEILTHDEIHKNALVKLSKREGIKWYEYSKKERTVLYLKESQQITDFLAMIGAVSASLAYESAIVYRSMRNKVNRLVNSETANLNKTMRASWRQSQKIKKIDNEVGLETLPKGLQEIALMRLKNPEYSLSELAENLKRPLSKSAVNYRLKKIEKYADQLKDK